jgi:hypothetical protein
MDKKNLQNLFYPFFSLAHCHFAGKQVTILSHFCKFSFSILVHNVNITSIRCITLIKNQTIIYICKKINKIKLWIKILIMEIFNLVVKIKILLNLRQKCGNIYLLDHLTRHNIINIYCWIIWWPLNKSFSSKILIFKLIIC